MKLHYTNILLFSFQLNILLFKSLHVYNKKSPYNNITRTKNPIQSNRSLCECDVYTSIYDNDPEIKEVMEIFDRQASQRFEEYNGRMIKNRQKCKEQCDKDIQKIILKDKIEKELKQQITTLETNITTKDIPTCVCKKSLAHKTENLCLKCGYGLGNVVPSVGLIGEVTLNVWKTAALASAKEFAEKAGATAGIKAGEAMGVKTVIEGLKTIFAIDKLDSGITGLIIDVKNYKNVSKIYEFIYSEYTTKCPSHVPLTNDSFCSIVSKLNTVRGYVTDNPFSTDSIIESNVIKIVGDGTSAAEATKVEMTLLKTSEFQAAKNGIIDATCMGYYYAIIASIVAIMVIVLVMVIIYLILRYRRKKKMKRKLQYIKLLKE
ncbi:PIR protein, putative [Plasmodium sp. gorilla clade G1]|nr:PIR protein, putative [Plasmodium sp. gorilla clade G1]